MIDVDQFENTAAWLEYCDGMTRFQAETEAARRQGVLRSEALAYAKNDRGNPKQARDQCSTPKRDNSDAMPSVQRGQGKQERSMPKRDVQA